MKVATLNQLVCLLPSSFFGPVLTPSANRVTARPVDVSIVSGWSASRPINCIFASGRGVVVENARKELTARGSVRRDCIMGGVYNGLSR
jgi:hypothetical protein